MLCDHVRVDPNMCPFWSSGNGAERKRLSLCLRHATDRPWPLKETGLQRYKYPAFLASFAVWHPPKFLHCRIISRRRDFAIGYLYHGSAQHSLVFPSPHFCMSTTTIDMARSAFSTAAFAQLVRRLRHSNARYNQIAHQFRCRIRPTHHARRRAYRAGLRIDTSKARACPEKYVSSHPPAVLDRSAVSPSWVDAHPGVYATAETGIGSEGHEASQGDAYMRGLALRNLPEVVVRKNRRRDGRQRVMLRLPPLTLQLNVGYSCGAPFQGPVPGAPRLSPRQLPEDESGVEEMMLGSASSSSSCKCDPVWWHCPETDLVLYLNRHGWIGAVVDAGM
jgi:hypothetical protein